MERFRVKHPSKTGVWVIARVHPVKPSQSSATVDSPPDPHPEPGAERDVISDDDDEVV